MKTRILSLLVLYFLYSPIIYGDTIELDFQGKINSGLISIGSIYTSQSSLNGVIFGLEQIINPSVPGPIADGFGTDSTRGLFNTFNPDTPIIADFSVLVDTVSYSSISGFPLSVRAFDAGDNEIGYSSIIDGTAIGTLVTSTYINYLKLYNDSGMGYLGLTNITAVSYLSFNTTSMTPAVVPLPAGIFLFSSGIMLLLGFKSMRRFFSKS